MEEGLTILRAKTPLRMSAWPSASAPIRRQTDENWDEGAAATKHMDSAVDYLIGAICIRTDRDNGRAATHTKARCAGPASVTGAGRVSGQPD